jgi:hypothetical protein
VVQLLRGQYVFCQRVGSAWSSGRDPAGSGTRKRMCVRASSLTGTYGLSSISSVEPKPLEILTTGSLVPSQGSHEATLSSSG